MDNHRAASWVWAGLGAGAMFVMDPARGRRRRAMAFDRAVHGVHAVSDAAAVTARDLSHRAAGAAARARSLVRLDGAAPDQVIEARVRAAIGRVVSHPGSIAVSSRGGMVTLDGPVFASEAPALIAAIRRVRGVHAVENKLSLHQTAGTVPGLQGGTRRPREAGRERVWSPTARLLAGSSGLALIAWGTRRSRLVAMGAVAGGALALTRSLLNVDTRRVLGLSGQRGVDVEKVIHIAAPVDQVFKVWQHYERFPQFMTHVRDVDDLGAGRSRWTVDGVGGAPVQFEAEVTKLVPNEVLAWRSVPGSPIGHTGLVRFDATPAGTTRVTVRMSYNPPGGIGGHGVARLFGTDPKHQLSDDLMRLKTLIETGKPARDAAKA